MTAAADAFWPSRPTEASSRVIRLPARPSPSGRCRAATASTQPTPTSAIAYSEAAITSTSRIGIESFHGRAMPRNAQNIHRQFESATGITTTTQSAACQRPTLRPRASRGKGTCEDTSTNTVQTQPNQLAQYYCLYKTARLAYSATLVTAPNPVVAPQT